MYHKIVKITAVYRTWAQTPIVSFWKILLRKHSSNLTVRHLKWFVLMREGSLEAACFYYALTLPSKANPADPEVTYLMQISLCRWYKSRGSLNASDQDAVCCAWNTAAGGDGICFPCIKQSSFRPAAWQPSSCPKQRCAVEKLEKKKAWNLTPLGDESNAPEPWPAPASHPLGRDTQRTREEQGTETGIRCAVDIQSMTRCTIVRALLINLCLCLDNFVISMFSVFLTPALVHSMLRASD